jgi:hypothetical protein
MPQPSSELADLIARAAAIGFAFESSGDVEAELLMLEEFLSEVQYLDELIEEHGEAIDPPGPEGLFQMRKRLWERISLGDWAGSEEQRRALVDEFCD